MAEWFVGTVQSMLDFSNVLNGSIAASWLILVVLCLRLLLKRAPKWINVALWGIVALRLMMPFSIESVFSLIPSEQTVSQQILRAEAVEGAQNAYLDLVTNPSFGNVVTVPLDRTISSFQWDLLDLNLIWLVGVAVMGAYALVSYMRLRRRLKTAVRLRENLYQCENVEIPFVLGIFRPRIYLPYRMDAQTMEQVVAHEKAHIQGKDHWWKPLGFMVLTVHWFNPLIWLGYICLCRDIELACDERVIRGLGKDQRSDYSQALLNCAVKAHMVTVCPLAFGEVGVKERVRRVLCYKKPGFWLVLTAAVVCVLVAVCFLTDPVTPSQNVLPCVHSHSYGVVEVTYESGYTNYSMVAQVNTPSYAVRDDMTLLSRGEYGDGWTELGTLEEAKLSRQTFDQLFYNENGWKKGESAASIRRNTAKVWSLIYEQEVLYYLIQQENGELFLAYGYYDYTEKNDAGSDDTAIRWLYRLAVDPEGSYGIVVRSGEYVIPVTLFPAGTAVGNYNRAIHWLTIESNLDDTVPFRVYRNGKEEHSFYTVVDAKTYEPLNFIIPSGLDPQTYLFQNADPEREYIVIGNVPSDDEGVLWCFGVRFAQSGNPVLKGTILAIQDGYFLVEPVPGSRENGPLQVPMVSMVPSPEPQVGDVLRIEYDGMIQKTDPGRLKQVYRISVEETETSYLTMIPTDAEVNGIYDRFLFYTIDGKKYRYERQETMPGGIQAGNYLATVFEDTGLGEQYAYTVYAVKNCADNSRLLVYSKDMDSMWLYQYSPSKAAEENALLQALDAGFVVMENGEAAGGQEVWQAFQEAVQAGEPAEVWLAWYFTMDPERCAKEYYEANREDYPSIYYEHLRFDGEEFTIRGEEDGEEYEKTYDYLRLFREAPGNYARYVLTNDATVTWDQIWNSLISSLYPSVIDHHTVYVECAK